MSGKESGFSSRGWEKSKYGRGKYTDDPGLFSYNSPLRQTIDSPPSRRRPFRSDSDDSARRQRDYSDRPWSRDYDDSRKSRNYERQYDDYEKPRSRFSYRDDQPGSAPGTLTSSLRGRNYHERDNPEKSYCAMAGDYLPPSDYDGRRRATPRLQDPPDFQAARRQRNAKADDLIKSILERDAIEQEFLKRRPRYSTEAHGMDSAEEARHPHDEGLSRKSGIIVGRPLMRDDRPYDSLPAMLHNLDRRGVTRSASLDDYSPQGSPGGGSTPTPDMYRSFSPQSVPYSPGPYSLCGSPPPGVPPPPSYARRFLDGIPVSPSSSIPSTPTASAPQTPTGTLTHNAPEVPHYNTSRSERDVPDQPRYSTSRSEREVPDQPNYNTRRSDHDVSDHPRFNTSRLEHDIPDQLHYNTSRPERNHEYEVGDYSDRTSQSDSGITQRKKTPQRKGLLGMLDSDWSDKGSLLREVLDRNFPGHLRNTLFDDEEHGEEEPWEDKDPDGKVKTREKTFDLGDGRTCHVKETRSMDRPDDPHPDRNLFDKYRFKFGSFGSFDHDDDDDDTSKDTIVFQDFDDFVHKLKEKQNQESPFNSLRKSPSRRAPSKERLSSLDRPSLKEKELPNKMSGLEKISEKDAPVKLSAAEEKPYVEKKSEVEQTPKQTDTKSKKPAMKKEATKVSEIDNIHVKKECFKEPISKKEDKSAKMEDFEDTLKNKDSDKRDDSKAIVIADDTSLTHNHKGARPKYHEESPPIDLVSKSTDKELSPPLGRSKIPIPLPYDKLFQDEDCKHCGKQGHVHTHECPADCQLTCHHKCRQSVALDCRSGDSPGPAKPKRETSLTRRQSGRALIISPYTVLFKKCPALPDLEEDRSRSPSKDDADSGYHTGESTLRDHTPGELTLTREELRKNIDAFNDNQHGLLMTLNEETATFQGFIRVHMNLMRPISMSLPSRPTSIYDVIGSDCDSDEPPCETLTTSFYLPKDTTKVIHISSATTTQEVIKALLQKFKITDNPRKFALYEKMEKDGAKATMRRLVEDERPLPLCLSWTAEGLESHKFILQENEPGEIVWEAFSIPELENFLKILDREEEEYVDQLRAKYKLLRIQMDRQMKTLQAEGETQAAACTTGPSTPLDNDTREPVYV